MSYAKVQYTATSTGNQPFGIPFTYLKAEHVFVFVDGVPTEFTWLNSASVQVNATAGQKVDIVRDTSSGQLMVDFKDGTVLKERDLNTGFQQAYFLGQEARDRAEAAISQNLELNWDADGKRLVNLADPVDPGDAVTKRVMQYEYPMVQVVGDNMGIVGVVGSDLSNVSLFQMDLGSVDEAPSMSTSGASSAIREVANISTSVQSVAFNMTQVRAVGDNITAVLAAEGNATAATTAATNAATSAANASTSESAAASSAATATTKAGEASTSATNSAASAATATTKAGEASTSATNAAASATSASASASTATTKAGEASTSATNAASSATAASTSAGTATTKAGEASTSATNAAASATTATTKAGEASTSATNAAASAATATTKAGEASTSATNAASSASAASTSASAALTHLNTFKGQYYGAFASDPALDPLGNALGVGDLYFNSTDGLMKVFNGTSWSVSYASSGGALVGANNLSDVPDKAAARANLGVAIGTDVQAFDADLGAIAALAGTSGLLKKTAANTWALDTTAYAQSGALGNVDFNTATTSGCYRFDTPTNGPTGINWGQLLVMHGGGDTITQIVSDFNTGDLYTRSGNPSNVGGGGTWRAWSKLVSSANLSSYTATPTDASVTSAKLATTLDLGALP